MILIIYTLNTLWSVNCQQIVPSLDVIMSIVAKVGTKAAMLNTLMSEEDDHMLLDFGKYRLDSDMLALAEKFLI